MKKSAYLAKQEEFRRASMEAMRETFTHYMTDTCAIALNDLGWGAKRINDFLVLWGKVYDDFFDVLRNTPETDYYRQKFDERLKPLNLPEDDFVPFEQRYEFLPDMRY